MTRTSSLLLLALLPTLALAAGAAGPGQGRSGERQAHAEARFDEADRNRDGKLDLAEWQDVQDRKLAERFQRIDADNDGALSRDELRQAHHGKSASRHQGQAMRHQLQALDSNNDKALTRAELGDKAPRLAENFDRIDGNRDGKLSHDELRAARETLGRQDRQAR